MEIRLILDHWVQTDPEVISKKKFLERKRDTCLKSLDVYRSENSPETQRTMEVNCNRSIRNFDSYLNSYLAQYSSQCFAQCSELVQNQKTASSYADCIERHLGNHQTFKSNVLEKLTSLSAAKL